jgi:hypothetical protein
MRSESGGQKDKVKSSSNRCAFLFYILTEQPETLRVVDDKVVTICL